MHSAELRSTTIPVTRFRDGYDVGEVDDFLERCARTLETIERHGTDLLETPDSIASHAFRTTRFRPGYDMQVVDDVLDHVAWRIREHLEA